MVERAKCKSSGGEKWPRLFDDVADGFYLFRFDDSIRNVLRLRELRGGRIVG